MDLSPNQRDAIAELINIGYGRAAAALSELTRHRVGLEAPDVSLHPIEDIPQVMGKSIGGGSLACVNQIFSGPIAGNAMLLLNAEAASALASLLEPQPKAGMSPQATEVVNETGSILLNACLGLFGNLLSVQVTFAVPYVAMDTANALITTITTGWEPSSHALAVRTKFVVTNSEVAGVVLIIFGIDSLERLLQHVDKWAASQGAPPGSSG